MGGMEWNIEHRALVSIAEQQRSEPNPSLFRSGGVWLARGYREIFINFSRGSKLKPDPDLLGCVGVCGRCDLETLCT